MTSVNINTRVPSPASPGAPHLVFFGDGDWEFCTAHDLAFVGDPLGEALIVAILNEIAVDCLDEDEMDECDGESLLLLTFNVEPGHADEVVIALHADGDWSLGLRGRTELKCEDPNNGVFNFIPMPDFFEDLNYWIKHNRKRMAEVEAEHPHDLTDLME